MLIQIKWHRHGTSLVPCWAGHQRVSVSGPTTLLVVKVRNRAVNGWGPQYPLKSIASRDLCCERIAQVAIITVCCDFFPFPRLNSHSHASYSHSHAIPIPTTDRIPIPMGIPWDPWDPSQSFPFPCTPLLYVGDTSTVYAFTFKIAAVYNKRMCLVASVWSNRPALKAPAYRKAQRCMLPY